jgi:2-keto-4-pentenoate hydratase/2-oxohepta-3-ene-1,7-dioic acid hydratase in catechol pathway
MSRLQPGDVILAGTPAGVGLVQKPPVYLKPGQSRPRLLQWLDTCGDILSQCHPIRISIALKNPDGHDWS